MHGCDVLNKRGFARSYVLSEHIFFMVIMNIQSKWRRIKIYYQSYYRKSPEAVIGLSYGCECNVLFLWSIRVIPIRTLIIVTQVCTCVQ